MNSPDDNLTPSSNMTPPQEQDLPDSLGKTINVPQDQVNAGDNTTIIPHDSNSPESLDEVAAPDTIPDDRNPQRSTSYSASDDDDDTDIMEEIDERAG